MNNHFRVGLFDTDPITHSLIPEFLDDDYAVYSFSEKSDLQLFLENDYLDVIICEAEARGADVRGICEKHHRFFPFIFISSRDFSDERRNCLRNVSKCYITRPFAPEDLKQALQTCLV